MRKYYTVERLEKNGTWTELCCTEIQNDAIAYCKLLTDKNPEKTYTLVTHMKEYIDF